MNLFLSFALGTPGIWVRIVPLNLHEQEPLPKFYYQKVKTTAQRFDPNPIWRDVSWVDAEDVPYRELRDKVAALTSRPNYYDQHGSLIALAVVHYKQWKRDFRNPYKFYAANTYYGAAKAFDPLLDTRKELKEIDVEINYGWSYFQKVPRSYNFVRRAYLANVNDGDNHKLGDLSKRLLKKEPFDIPVVCALSSEYTPMKPNVEFEAWMFERFRMLEKKQKHGRPELKALSWAQIVAGMKRNDRDIFKTGLDTYKRFIATLTGPWERERPKHEAYLKNLRTDLTKPNLGIPPGGKYVDDIDP